MDITVLGSVAASCDGADIALYACSSCHSLQIVMQQRQPRAGWAYLLDWMEAKQGMAPLPADDEDILLDYLAAHFGGE